MSKRQRKQPGALRVDPRMAAMPPPSKAMIEEMAIGMHLAVSGHASVTLDMPDPVEWSDLREQVQDSWRAGARIAYSVVAIHGGSALRPIEEEQGDAE